MPFRPRFDVGVVHRAAARSPLALFAPRMLPRAIAIALATGALCAAHANTPTPTSVAIAGSFDQVLGCPGDWQPECAAVGLKLDTTDNIWKGSFAVPVGSWQYKAALNGGWTENYGANGVPGGNNLSLTQSGTDPVKFYYDHNTHWITSNLNSRIVVATGDFQAALGCPGNWQPSCLRSWLEDVNGTGTYTFSTNLLPAGNYQVKAALNEGWNENYGAGGAAGGANITFTVPYDNAQIGFSFESSTNKLTVADGSPKGNINLAKAYWLAHDLIAWDLGADSPTATVVLHAASDAALTQKGNTVEGGERITLTYDPSGVPASITVDYPHLAGLPVYRLSSADGARARDLLKGRVAVTAASSTGVPLDATGLQTANVIDDVFTYDGALGVVWSGSTPTLKLWAPTAHSVKVRVYDSATATTESATQDLKLDAATGVWSLTGSAAWNRKYYVYDVEVYAPSAGQIVHNLVTDPYSVSLAANSTRSQFVNLNDRDLKPFGWDWMKKPALSAFDDIALYELHVRDFSINDTSVPQALRGTFKAFGLSHTKGMRHLRELANNGLTHVHLLPVFDIATVPENKADQKVPAGDLSGFAADSDQQQAAVAAVKDADGFNWGYDPYHYTVPEGSYATNPNGATRIVEFREMVKGLSDSGLRTVMDVVYNHTASSGQNDHSVLDKIVPTYYHRLNKEGSIEHDSCCEDTASEHKMFEKLMVDSLVTWAKAYKVDGFRFDIMGFHMKRNLLKIRAALDALTLEKDGVDGKKIYLYGEGWNFGDVANNHRGVTAAQLNLAGTGIGSFSDRLRDSARGGNPFGGYQAQGYVTGLYVDPNGTPEGDGLGDLLTKKDIILVNLAGNLSDVKIVDHNGNTVRGSEVIYGGQPSGYTAQPQESINYLSAHDGLTLFDTIQVKAAATDTMADRVRMNNLGNSLVAFAQGIPFFHAGDEILRSKSMDANSYNAGDWFNKLDFTYQSNNWGVGLPSKGDNGSNWGIVGPLLANPSLKPTAADIHAALAHFEETLAVRRSIRLLRLRTHDEVINNLHFHNTGPSQIPGLIAMEVADTAGTVDRANARVLVLFNADPKAVTFGDADLTGAAWALHPLQAKSSDPVLRTAAFDATNNQFSVPGRSVAVFWVKRSATEQFTLLNAWVDQLVTAKSLSQGSGKLIKANLAAAQKLYNAGNRRAADALLDAARDIVKSAGQIGLLDSAVATDLAQSLSDLDTAINVTTSKTSASVH